MSVENTDDREEPLDADPGATASPRRPDRNRRPERTDAEPDPRGSLAADLAGAASLVT